MALSAEEIRTLNEIARRMAEEDPELVRRLMPDGRSGVPEEAEAGYASGYEAGYESGYEDGYETAEDGSGEDGGVRRIEIVEVTTRPEPDPEPRRRPSLRGAAPAALAGVLLLSGAVVSLLIAARNTRGPRGYRRF